MEDTGIPYFCLKSLIKVVKGKPFLDQFSGLKVLVIGDVMIDRYLVGSVDRISPEAPVPVVLLNSRDNRLGGAANVALNLKALGAEPYLCSVTGQDKNGEIFAELLPEAGLSNKGILPSPERRTTIKTRVLAQNQQLMRVDEEDRFELSDSERKAFLERIRSLLESKNIDLILFQDYNKGVLTQAVIREIILEAIKRDIPTAVDPKNLNFWEYKRVQLFKPNLSEVRAKLPMEVNSSLESLQEAAAYIHRKLDNPYTMITLSEKGLFITDHKDYLIVPAEARDIADVCGAGDTVVSVASLGMALGWPLREIALLSNLAGGQVCEKVGVVPVDKLQLEQEYTDLLSKRVSM